MMRDFFYFWFFFDFWQAVVNKAEAVRLRVRGQALREVKVRYLT